MQGPYPLRLLIVLHLRHFLPHTVGVDQGPLRKLDKHFKLEEDVKLSELPGLLIYTKGISIGCFCHILATCVFIKYLWTSKN